MDVLFALEAAGSVKAFVEEGHVEQTMAEVSTDAARRSLAARDLARDGRGRTWSTISHLEQAESALRRVLASPRMYWLSLPRYELAAIDCMTVLCLQAVCYRYLEEDELCRRSLEQADEVYQTTMGSRCGSQRRTTSRIVASGFIGLADLGAVSRWNERLAEPLPDTRRLGSTLFPS